MKNLAELTRKELAGKWFDLQVERGMNLTNRTRFIKRCLNGVGAMKPMRKAELISCIVNAQISISSEFNLKTYTVSYRYYGCKNSFEKHIAAESLAEAMFDTKSWIEAQNATIGTSSKVGNYINVAIVRDWSGKEQGSIEL